MRCRLQSKYFTLSRDYGNVKYNIRALAGIMEKRNYDAAYRIQSHRGY